MQHGAASSTVSWVGWNLAAEAVRRRHEARRSLLVRYEDFIAEPRAVLLRIAQLVGETGDELPFDGDRTVRLARNHTVSGNPSRFKTGPVELREDREWLTRQPVVDRLTVTAMALPLLRRYGYPVRVGAHRAPTPS